MTSSQAIANVLTIAGSDPSGGAGIQADLKTFSALGTYGTSVITALTAQNTCGVTGVHPIPTDFIAAQLDTLMEDVPLAGVKIGMVASREVAVTIRETLEKRRPRWIVLDPVMVAKSGDVLVDDVGIQAVRELLVPLADLITPNLPEAAVLLESDTPRDRQAMEALLPQLIRLGAENVLLKGGHLQEDRCPDLLGGNTPQQWLDMPRVPTNNLHGTGCSLSSAITAYLARGNDLPSAVEAAKRWLCDALQASERLHIGKGHGPVHHFHAWW
ncbi:bifunctional hydroxymethylpyrimidine kinase/phosphomethylpyrimidine kinase [Aidingimonas halophila]|uniref:hydroxymethylpyrimidine kinase n=1 Tax=Aidingimonas halophila TaxID=574349 RepID=A0A1H2Y4H9_9GAMM|nr:bifunctional hydroxymethylpyrimidine kinase/phosphomethylpyrimidine kinase [Aidingimonas halophila]GHC34447.1 hydroxymethylpyrimidine/phosphomethylpyrimidine kinase [Aidingimonas halophila]SDX00036.1 hydroxymethylpyrimidine kinase /phosphomethylpyrimidine kinase [Aidingimonas halophila]